MRMFSSSKQIHKWAAIVTFLPLGLIFVTGVLLSVSPWISFFQPAALKSSSAQLLISLEQALVAAQSVPEAGIHGWDDVMQIDVRPAAGVMRVRAKNYWEVQIDGRTGQVIGHGRRLKTLLVTLHDGAWFADGVKQWIFIPTGMIAVLLWGTGLILFMVPFFKRRKKA